MELALQTPQRADTRIESIPARFRETYLVTGQHIRNTLALCTIRARHRNEEPPATSMPYVVLDDVWAHPKARGQGHATRMLLQAQAAARRRGWAIMCRPHPHAGGQLAPLLKLYARLGWQASTAPGWLVWWG